MKGGGGLLDVESFIFQLENFRLCLGVIAATDATALRPSAKAQVGPGEASPGITQACRGLGGTGRILGIFFFTLAESFNSLGDHF